MKDAIQDALPKDEEERQLCSLVEAATSEALLAPDWQANMELVDALNRQKGYVCYRYYCSAPKLSSEPAALLLAP